MVPRQKLLYKIASCILAIVIIIVILYTNSQEEAGGEGYSDAFVIVRNSESEDDDFGESETQIHNNRIVNLTGFEYKIRNSLCGADGEELLGVIIVTSYVGHDQLRAAHRQAIAQTKLKEMGFIRVFLLADIPAKEKFITQPQIDDESKKFGDLLQGNFNEAYRNLTYKHIMGLRWTALECAKAKFVIKIDDDIVFDIFHVRNYLESLEIKGYPKNFFAGYILDAMPPIRLSANKWFVSRGEFSGDMYPDYLSGWLYITNPDTARRIVVASQRSQFFWIDDTLVTGILRAKLKIPLLRLNNWFASNSQFIDCCVRDLKAFTYECEYFVGPNGGDSKLIVEFTHEVEKCYFDECGKRGAEKSLKRTCVGEVKNVLQDHGEALVRSVALG